MSRIIILLLSISLIACANEEKAKDQGPECTPLIINGVAQEGWHEFALNDVRWAKAYQCGVCTEYEAATGVPTRDRRCD